MPWQYPFIDGRSMRSISSALRALSAPPSCVHIVEAPIPAPAAAGVWQYIPLPHGTGATGAAAGTLRTGYREGACRAESPHAPRTDVERRGDTSTSNMNHLP